MMWWWIRLREGSRWLFRGISFEKLERDINAMAEPLNHQGVPNRHTERIRQRVEHAITWLPRERAEKFMDMMARSGHPVKWKGL